MGALGARLDHTLANVLLLALPEFQGVSVRIVDGEGEVMMVPSGKRASLKGKTGDLVSLLPLCGPAHGVTTAGLAWALERRLPQDEVARWGVAAGTAAAVREGVGVGTRPEVERLFQQTETYPVEGKGETDV